MYHVGPREVTPEERLYLLNEDQWEGFIEDCARQLMDESSYVHVQLLGGAGDKGRDVCGYTCNSHAKGTWDLYQGKFYKDTLSPSQFLPDVAKFIYYVFNGDYTLPRSYFICALKVGTSLFDLVNNPENMREYVLDKWTEKGSFPSFRIALTEELISYIKKFPFEVFAVKTPKDLLTIHARNGKKHWEKFGILAQRGANPIVPKVPNKIEGVYIDELVNVYSSNANLIIPLTVDLIEEQGGFNWQHLKNQRNLFYCAEGLNRFSRDKLPGAFDDLLDIVSISIERILIRPYQDPIDKIDRTLDKAEQTRIESNPLKERVNSTDLAGSCHHLVNRGKVKWM
ncbi:ABC-three component system protein [Vibrio splendidus]|uniref:ABC-three component system protein n=1 Tax=Vibrio splendidus TaxID=29497 RepID=UPI000C82CBFC|nr:ABC-three component system protein [Vibrio splendidus]PMG22541.1 hypothetical protein BCU95_17050 [Vibrio splendidus]